MEAMTEDEILELVRDRGLAHVALAKGDDAYAIPVFYAYDGEAFFFHSHHGVKEDYLKKTGEACLVVARVDSPDVWQSVQVFGPVRKIGGGPDLTRAQEALLNVPVPPEKGTTKSGQPRRSEKDTFVWALDPHSMTGRKSAPAPPDSDPATA